MSHISCHIVNIVQFVLKLLWLFVLSVQGRPLTLDWKWQKPRVDSDQ